MKAGPKAVLKLKPSPEKTELENTSTSFKFSKRNLELHSLTSTEHHHHYSIHILLSMRKDVQFMVFAICKAINRRKEEENESGGLPEKFL